MGYRSTCYILYDWYSLWPAEARQWSRRRRLTRPNITLLHTLHRLLGPSAHYTILSSTHNALIQALGGTAGSCDVTDTCVTCWVLPFCCSWIHIPLRTAGSYDVTVSRVALSRFAVPGFTALLLCYVRRTADSCDVTDSWILPFDVPPFTLSGEQRAHRTSLRAILYVTCWTSLFLDSHISCSFSRRTADSLFDVTEAKPRKAVYRSNITRKRYTLRMSFPTWTSLVWFGLVPGWCYTIELAPLRSSVWPKSEKVHYWRH